MKTSSEIEEIVQSNPKKKKDETTLQYFLRLRTTKTKFDADYILAEELKDSYSKFCKAEHLSAIKNFRENMYALEYNKSRRELRFYQK